MCLEYIHRCMYAHLCRFSSSLCGFEGEDIFYFHTWILFWLVSLCSCLFVFMYVCVCACCEILHDVGLDIFMCFSFIWSIIYIYIYIYIY